MKLTFPAQSYKIREICLIAQNLFYDWSIPETTTQDIVLAIEESLANIMEHGYENSKEKTCSISIEITRESSDIKVMILDFARPYSLANLLYPDLYMYIKSEAKGGFGVSIMKKLMDSVQVKYSNGSNILTMTKHIPDTPPYFVSSIPGRISTKTIEATVFNGILIVNAKPNCCINLQDARINIESYKKMVETYPENQVFAKVIDHRKISKISLNAQKFHVEEEPSHVKALAIIDDSLFKRLFINFLAIFKRNIRAVRMFKSKSAAIRWARKFADKQVRPNLAFIK